MYLPLQFTRATITTITTDIKTTNSTMYMIPLTSPQLKETFKPSRAVTARTSLSSAGPKRTAQSSKRVEANLACTAENRCLLIDENKLQTAVVHEGRLTRSNHSFQSHIKEALELVRKRWEEYQRVCHGEPASREAGAIALSPVSTPRLPRIDSSKVPNASPIAHPEELSVCEIFGDIGCCQASPADAVVDHTEGSLRQILTALAATSTCSLSDESDWVFLEGADVEDDYVLL